MTTISVLKVTLHGQLVGHLVGEKGGRNTLIFHSVFQQDSDKPTLTLAAHPRFPKADVFFSTPWKTQFVLPPVLSNLLPEGALRELLLQRLQIHTSHEFELLAHLGGDLPGALVVQPVLPEEVPQEVLALNKKAVVIAPEATLPNNKFSLAGVQMKWSLQRQGDRFTLPGKGAFGDWIIKTPSFHHAGVPVNEYTAMRLAQLVGVETPEICLVELSHIEGLPPIKLPDEPFAFAIKRFDRVAGQRVHTEDFAQVLLMQPRDKYQAANYEQMGRLLYEFSGNGLADVQQFAKRLLVNILLANGDAHLKNWSLIYPDQKTPRLAPAYDLVTTKVYIPGEKGAALNMVKTKAWESLSLAHFERWSRRVGVSWPVVQKQLGQSMEMAREFWPRALDELPMHSTHKAQLKQHWASLHLDFRIQS